MFEVMMVQKIGKTVVYVFICLCTSCNNSAVLCGKWKAGLGVLILKINIPQQSLASSHGPGTSLLTHFASIFMEFSSNFNDK